MHKLVIALALVLLAACGSANRSMPVTTTKAASATTSAPTVPLTMPATTVAPITIAPTTTVLVCGSSQHKIDFGNGDECRDNIAAPTTIPEKHLSRDAVVAVTRCVDAITTFGLSTDIIEFGDLSRSDDAMAMCKEAHTQITVDGLPRGNRLAVQISQRQLDLVTIEFDFTSGAIAKAKDEALAFEVSGTSWSIDAGRSLAAASGA